MNALVLQTGYAETLLARPQIKNLTIETGGGILFLCAKIFGCNGLVVGYCGGC